ncbi:MAG TPA: universal stress protein [Candidatus Dormibacteraeota bacterium]|nr:universal stress protein [Candidatus Dormibacteraeota bacterium]
MYSRVLFAIDDDEALPTAVPAMAAYARGWGAEVRVLHVLRVDPDTADDAVRKLVQDVVRQLQAAGVNVQGEVRLVVKTDSVARVIAQSASKAEADLVAIGSHGRSDLAALFLGSVSHDVASRLDVPVLVLRSCPAAPAAPGAVLLAVDGSTASEEATSEAADLAKAFGARVHVLHVQQLVVAEGAAVVEPDDATADAIVRDAVAALEARGVPATGETAIEHSIVACIVSTAERQGADVVVLGSRRPSGLGGLLLGSVGHSVVHRLRCPVLLAGRRQPAESIA